MLPENTITELKALFEDAKKFFFNAEPEASQKFSLTGTLEDGTVVEIEAEMPTIGTSIVAVSTDGTKSPIADGEYIVKIGETSYKIKTAGGMVAESDAPLEKPEEAPMPEETPMPEAPVVASNEIEMQNEKIAELEARIKSLEEGKKEDKSKMEESSSAVKEITVKMQSQIDAVAKENEMLRESSKKLIEGIEAILNKPASAPTHKKPETKISNVSIDQFRKQYLNY